MHLSTTIKLTTLSTFRRRTTVTHCCAALFISIEENQFTNSPLKQQHLIFGTQVDNKNTFVLIAHRIRSIIKENLVKETYMKYVQVTAEMCAEKDGEAYPTKVICEACFNVIMKNPEQNLIAADAAGTPEPEAECEFRIAHDCESL
jgi:hypothetical protein